MFQANAWKYSGITTLSKTKRIKSGWRQEISNKIKRVSFKDKYGSLADRRFYSRYILSETDLRNGYTIIL